MKFSEILRCSGLPITSVILLQGCVTATKLQGQVLDGVEQGSIAVQDMACETGNGDAAFALVELDNFLRPTIELRMQKPDSSDIEYWFRIGRDDLLSYAQAKAKAKGDDPSIQVQEDRLISALGVSSQSRVIELLSVPMDGAIDADKVISQLSAAFPDYRSSRGRDKLVLPASLLNSDVVAKVTAKRGWDAALIASHGKVLALRKLNEGDPQFSTSTDAQLAIADSRRKLFVSEYFSAYFKHGKLFRVELITNSTRDELIAKLSEGIDDPDVLNEIKKRVDETFSSLLDGVCKGNNDEACVLLGIESDASFVSRASKTISFPGVVATIDPNADKKVSTNKLDTEDIGHEMLEVLIEAVADANYLVPGAPTSTACQKIKSIEGLCQTEGNKDKLSAVNEAAARTEASARAVVSVLVRGGWLFSLNNESLADWLETLTAVTARKISEAAEWSKQSCGDTDALFTEDKFVDLELKIPSRSLLVTKQ